MILEADSILDAQTRLLVMSVSAVHRLAPLVATTVPEVVRVDLHLQTGMVMLITGQCLSILSVSTLL